MILALFCLLGFAQNQPPSLRGLWRAAEPAKIQSKEFKNITVEQEIRFNLNRWESIERVYGDTEKKKLWAVIRKEGPFQWKEKLEGTTYLPIELRLASKTVAWKEKDWKVARKIGLNCGLVKNDDQDLSKKSCGFLKSISDCPVLHENILVGDQNIQLTQNSPEEEPCLPNPAKAPQRSFIKMN